MATCMFVCVNTTNTAVVSKQTIKNDIVRLCIGATFASFVESLIRGKATVCRWRRPNGYTTPKWEEKNVKIWSGRTKTFNQNVGGCTDGPFGTVRIADAINAIILCVLHAPWLVPCCSTGSDPNVLRCQN
jgi:hypothetical protein